MASKLANAAPRRCEVGCSDVSAFFISLRPRSKRRTSSCENLFTDPSCVRQRFIPELSEGLLHGRALEHNQGRGVQKELTLAPFSERGLVPHKEDTMFTYLLHAATVAGLRSNFPIISAVVVPCGNGPHVRMYTVQF